jgi:methylglyoxal synthase
MYYFSVHQIILILQKRKISDLDHEWSKEQLIEFYEAYREYGKDWNMVSTVKFP